MAKEAEQTPGCRICFDPLDGPVQLGCGHEYHGECLGRWEQTCIKFGAPTCPVCRARFESFDELLERGRALKKRAIWDDAAASLRKAAAMRPRNARAQFALGVVLNKLGDLEGAAAAYRAAFASDPECPAASFNLGVVLFEQRDLHGAVGRGVPRHAPCGRAFDAAHRLATGRLL